MCNPKAIYMYLHNVYTSFQIVINSTGNTIDCGTLSSPSNGQVTLTGTAVGSTATYDCNSGFNLVGNMQRTCQNSGDWSGTQPTCDGNTQIPLLIFVQQAMIFL